MNYPKNTIYPKASNIDKYYSCRDSKGYFKIDNYFSELTDDAQRVQCLSNLGIDHLKHEWGNIQGDINLQKDLIQLINKTISESSHIDASNLVSKEEFTKAIGDLTSTSGYIYGQLGGNLSDVAATFEGNACELASLVLNQDKYLESKIGITVDVYLARSYNHDTQKYKDLYLIGSNQYQRIIQKYNQIEQALKSNFYLNINGNKCKVVSVEDGVIMFNGSFFCIDDVYGNTVTDLFSGEYYFIPQSMYDPENNLGNEGGAFLDVSGVVKRDFTETDEEIKQLKASVIPTKTSQLENDSEYVKRFILNIDAIAHGASGTLTKSTWDKITGDYLVCVNDSGNDCLFNNVQIIVTSNERWIYFRDHLAKKDVEIYIVFYDLDNTVNYTITLS